MTKKLTLTDEERFARWIQYVKAAFDDITTGFWNRKVFANNVDLVD